LLIYWQHRMMYIYLIYPCIYFIYHVNTKKKKTFQGKRKKRDFIVLLSVILLLFLTAGVHMINVVQFKGKAKMAYIIESG